MKLRYKKDYFMRHEGKYNYLSDDDFRQLKVHLPPVPDGARVLDLGGGSGALGERVAQLAKSAKPITIDLSLPLLRWCSMPCCQGDACCLPVGDSVFDYVVVGAAFHHFPDIPASLREILRILRPGGRVFAYDPNVYHPQRRICMRAPLRYFFYETGDVALSPYWFRQKLYETSFDNVHIWFVAFGGNGSGRVARLNHRLLAAVSRPGTRFLEPLVAPWYVVTAKKPERSNA